MDRSAQVLSAIQRIPCAIAGGDIFGATGRVLTPTFENWRCEIERGEAWPDYVRRSSAQAAQYLSGLRRTRPLWFIPVCTLEPTPAQRLGAHAHHKT